jgi:hypothetical protein
LLDDLDTGHEDAVSTMTKARLIRAAFNSATRMNATVSLRTVARYRFKNLFPLQVAIFGIDHDPIQAESDGHRGNSG